VTAQAICERLVSEPFRSGFQTEDRKRAYIPKFLPYFVDSKLFQLKQNRNRLVPVTLEFVTICDICNQNMTKSVLLQKLKKPQSADRGHKFKIVTFCDRHKCHQLSVTGTKPVSVSVWNPDWNGS